MDFESFEGFKRVKNNKNLDLEDVLELLKMYETKIGKFYRKDNSKNIIIIENDEKYYIEIRVFSEEIVIEVKSNMESDTDSTININEEKDLQLVRTNRLIEQLYDLLNDYIKNGTVKEHITAVRRTLYMKEKEKSVLGGTLSFGNKYEVTDDTNELVYEINQSHINKLYSIKNLRTRREDVVVKYENADENKFTILKQPFEKIDIEKDESNIKTIFKGKISGKELKISADYTENHFLVEVSEIVVGAIDCLDPKVKKEYNLEINSLDYEYLIISIAIMLDIYALNNDFSNK